MPQLLRALEAIHDPRSSNDLRHEATAFLERAKLSPQAFRRGFDLAVSPSPAAAAKNAPAQTAQDTVVRHFGLSMMLYYLKYVFEPDGGGGGGGTAVSAEELPRYAFELARSLRSEDPAFVRNKVAQIWTDVAKRVWGSGGWMNMDAELVALWALSAPHRAFVLAVLEGLSDDIFIHEDHVAGLRADLGSALTRICVTDDFIAAHHPKEGHDQLNELRCGNEGWLRRLCDYLKECLDQSASQHGQLASEAVRVLNVLQSLCCWLPLKSLISVSCVQSIAYALAVGNTQIRLVRWRALADLLTDRRRPPTRSAPYSCGPTSIRQTWRTSSRLCTRTKACNCCMRRTSGQAKLRRTRTRSTRLSRNWQRFVRRLVAPVLTTAAPYVSRDVGRGKPQDSSSIRKHEILLQVLPTRHQASQPPRFPPAAAGVAANVAK
jgi:Exportin 1-like protein